MCSLSKSMRSRTSFWQREGRMLGLWRSREPRILLSSRLGAQGTSTHYASSTKRRLISLSSHFLQVNNLISLSAPHFLCVWHIHYTLACYQSIETSWIITLLDFGIWVLLAFWVISSSCITVVLDFALSIMWNCVGNLKSFFFVTFLWFQVWVYKTFEDLFKSDLSWETSVEVLYDLLLGDFVFAVFRIFTIISQTFLRLSFFINFQDLYFAICYLLSTWLVSNMYAPKDMEFLRSKAHIDWNLRFIVFDVYLRDIEEWIWNL